MLLRRNTRAENAQCRHQTPIYSVIALFPSWPNSKYSTLAEVLLVRCGVTEPSFLLRHRTLSAPISAEIFKALLLWHSAKADTTLYTCFIHHI